MPIQAGQRSATEGQTKRQGESGKIREAERPESDEEEAIIQEARAEGANTNTPALLL